MNELHLADNYIKMRYVYEGYLPNIPYHLVADSEMCDAFLPEDMTKSCYFCDNYPLLNEDLKECYDNLISKLRHHLDAKKADPQFYELPDWVYSYMMGSVTGPMSSEEDRHDLLALLHTPNIANEFTGDTQIDCHRVSEMWLLRQQAPQDEPVTVFGALHVIKSLRLEAAAIVE